MTDDVGWRDLRVKEDEQRRGSWRIDREADQSAVRRGRLIRIKGAFITTLS